MIINPQLKNPNFYVMILTDSGLFIIALLLTYMFRFEFNFAQIDFHQIGHMLRWMIPLKLLIFFSFGLYKGMWRYTSLRDIWSLAGACFVSTALVILTLLIVYRFQGYSRSILFGDGILTFILTGGKRVIIRSFYALSVKQMTNAFTGTNI
jgi:FlaA1/EpsC-like NDP-sugar epimerase